MKLLVIFSALLAIGACYPVVKTWTLSRLSDAIESKRDPAMMPYYEDALNRIMLALFTGKNLKLYQAVIPSPSGKPTWTVDELKNAVEDHNLNEEYRAAVLQAHDILKQKNATGELQNDIEVAIPALDISLWTFNDLNEALRSPTTKAELIPYLEKARSELKKSQDEGITKETIGMVTPVGLIPQKADYAFIPKASKRLIKKTRKGLYLD